MILTKLKTLFLSKKRNSLLISETLLNMYSMSNLQIYTSQMMILNLWLLNISKIQWGDSTNNLKVIRILSQTINLFLIITKWAAIILIFKTLISILVNFSLQKRISGINWKKIKTSLIIIIPDIIGESPRIRDAESIYLKIIWVNKNLITSPNKKWKNLIKKIN